MSTWTERAKAAVSKQHPSCTAKTDETPVSRLLTVSSVATAVVPIKPDPVSSVLAVTSPAIVEKFDLCTAPDRWCWPRVPAMNGAEMETSAMRAKQFRTKGMSKSAAETLATKLTLRDQEQDDRIHCVECKHLTGTGAGAWWCGNWKAAGVALCSRDAQLPGDWVTRPQRCHGFTPHFTSTQQVIEEEDRHD